MTANVNSGSTYLITNVKAQTAIDLSAGDNATITGWPVNGGANQHWTLDWTGNSWTFRSPLTGHYLSTNGSTSDGVRLEVSNTPFQWQIWRDDSNPNTFRIFVPSTHENLDLFGHGLAAPGTPITLWTSYNLNGLHQTWNFTQAPTSVQGDFGEDLEVAADFIYLFDPS